MRSGIVFLFTLIFCISSRASIIPVGTGDSTSYVVLNFSDGAVYQFDVSYDASSSPTGMDLLNEIAASQPLVIDAQTYDIGTYVNGLTYGSDSDDGYAGGDDWWHYWVRDSESDPWTSPADLASNRTVSNGSWDGWVYGNDSAPVPEPAMALSASGLLLLIRRRRSALVVAAGAALVLPSLALATDSASIVPGSLTQGTVEASLTGGAYANESDNLGDWPLNTGGFASTVFPVSISNADFNGNAFGGTPNTMIAFGNGGGVTLKFTTPITPTAGEKDLGIFTAQALNGGNGSFFNGNMEVAILVSADGNNWYTLSGTKIDSPTTYTTTAYPLNAPTVAYDYGAAATAWQYGEGTSIANLAALSIADYTTPMPNDDVFNGAGTDAQRLALTSDAIPSDYADIFGLSGGGNWFDISGSGLSQVDYVRLNGDANDPSTGGVRLDAVFANASAVPEPTLLFPSILACAALPGRRRRAR
ncbi:MAG TPA: hypothetical protein VG722_12855 [Tepidisphaeraceae bacterium]|nr:hypothetical protein [Tepidisphaeraceae bacterium]